MPITNFHGQTFVAFLDISGFKELMKDDAKALEALSRLYQAGYDVLQEQNGIQGFFVSDSGILFAREGDNREKLHRMLTAVRSINEQMLEGNYMLTTSIAFGPFDYQEKLEFDGIEKNPIYGNAYVKAFLDNEKVLPRIQPGQCRIVLENFPEEINTESEDFDLLQRKRNDHKHLYFYWNLNRSNQIQGFETNYNDSYKLKYAGMLQSLKRPE